FGGAADRAGLGQKQDKACGYAVERCHVVSPWHHKGRMAACKTARRGFGAFIVRKRDCNLNRPMMTLMKSIGLGFIPHRHHRACPGGPCRGEMDCRDKPGNDDGRGGASYVLTPPPTPANHE